MTACWELRETLTASGKYPKDAAEQYRWILQTMQAQNPTAAVYYQQLVYLQQNNPGCTHGYQATRPSGSC
jgi:hypothetical protein